ncbi:TPA: ORF6C domain-containing protein [Clostridioides difficile]|nr:ORF6C domain-containing protein [Clostridioides difficile]
MMNNLELVKSESFGKVQCDFYENDTKDILMTREQIGTALGYSEPRVAIAKMHNRYKDRLDKFSGVVSLVSPQGTPQDTIVYTAKGVMEICRYSRQPKADDFMDWVWDVVDTIRKTGSYDINNLEERVAPMIFNGILAGIKQVAIENDKKIDTRFNQIENKLDKKYEKQDRQFQEMKNMIGFKAKNTRMLSKLLKIKLSELKGYNVNAYNYDYRTVVTRLFSIYNVEKWEDIPVSKFNEVHALIDGIESMDDVYTWNN